MRDVAGLVARARLAAEADMVDTCTVTRAGIGPGRWDEATGQTVPPARVTVFAGRCKVQAREMEMSSTESAGRPVVEARHLLHLPVVESAGVRAGDVARIDSALLDPSLVGRRFVVEGPHVGSAKSSRRLPVSGEVAS